MDKYKILIIAPAWVGDLVMSQTLFKLLKSCYQDNLQLDVFASAATKDLLLRMPEVGQIIDNPFGHGKLKLWQRIKIGLSLRRNKYKQVFVLPNSFKSAIVPFFAGIKKRTGFLGESRYILLNDYYKLNPQELPLMIDRFCALANHGRLPQVIDWPRLATNAANQERLVEKFSLPNHKQMVAFCPGAEYGPAKRWLPEHFVQLARQLAADGYHIIILGSAKDAAISDTIIKQLNNATFATDLCSKTNLTDAVDLLALARYVITNDSGLMHIACAVRSQVIAVYGSTSTQFTPPLAKNAQVLSVKLDCSPCFQRTCRFGHYNCLRFITPEKVYASLEHALDRKPK